VFTWIVRVKVKLFTVNFLGGAKLFTVGCGEWFLRLSLPPMNNFGGTISKRRKQSGRNFAKNAKQPRAGQSGSLKWMARWVLMGGWPSVSKRLHEKRERQNCVNSERTDAGTPARSFCRRRQLSGISG
jgi:hypothetical protein